MKTLVVFYSKSGNNAFLAKKIARQIGADLEILKPTLAFYPMVMLLSMLKTGSGIKQLKSDVNQYDHIIICGPIWAGFLCSPLVDFIRKFQKKINKLFFATCCGSDDTKKDDKFGYVRVFHQVKELAGNKCIHCEAFPISLALPADKRADDNEIMQTKLSDNNFSEELQEKLNNLVTKIQ
jgi:flavodoxin